MRSVELERLIAEGQTLLERRQVFEYLRDRAGEHYETLTGSAWRPRSGSLVNHAKLTASLLGKPRIPLRQAPRRNRGASAERHPHRLFRRHRLQRSQAHLAGAR